MSVLQLMGALADDAQAVCTRDGEHILRAMLCLPNPPAAGPLGRAVQVRLHKSFGTGNAAGYAANARAHQLRRGVRVHVGGNRVCMQRGKVVLSELDFLLTPDIPLDQRNPTDN